MFEGASNMKFADFGTTSDLKGENSMSPFNALQAALATTQPNEHSVNSGDKSQCMMKCTREFQTCTKSCI